MIATQSPLRGLKPAISGLKTKHATEQITHATRIVKKPQTKYAKQFLTAVILDIVKTSNMKSGIVFPDGYFVRGLFPGF